MKLTDYLLGFYIEQNGETISPELAEGVIEELYSPEQTQWTMAECKQIGDSLNIDWDSILVSEWFCMMNKFYFEYNETFRRHGLIDPTIYAEMSLIWFATGNKNKTFKYFFE